MKRGIWWEKHLQDAHLFAYNSSLNISTNKSPPEAFIFYQRQPIDVTRLDCLLFFIYKFYCLEMFMPMSLIWLLQIIRLLLIFILYILLNVELTVIVTLHNKIYPRHSFKKLHQRTIIQFSILCRLKLCFNLSIGPRQMLDLLMAHEYMTSIPWWIDFIYDGWIYWHLILTKKFN